MTQTWQKRGEKKKGKILSSVFAGLHREKRKEGEEVFAAACVVFGSGEGRGKGGRGTRVSISPKPYIDGSGGPEKKKGKKGKERRFGCWRVVAGEKEGEGVDHPQ